MATKLFLRRSTDNGISGTGDGVVWDMLPVAGVLGANWGTVNTAASGTEIQWTEDGVSTIAWISGRAPAGGFTLTSTDISAWMFENNMSANIGGRYRVFKRTGAGVITELGGGPFDDGIEFGTVPTEMTWIGNVTDTTFAEDDRILLRVYITNVGTMAVGFTGGFNIDGPDGGTEDSFFNIAETVTFKAESDPGTAAARPQGRFNTLNF